jgi:hypothetical protein
MKNLLSFSLHESIVLLVRTLSAKKDSFRKKIIAGGYLSAGLTGVAVVTLSLTGCLQKTVKPNIIIIYADDLGYGDVSCYGATRISTPNIDRLAKHGLRFVNAHSTSSTCTPSRYSLLTGEYAWRKSGTGVLTGDASSIIQPGRTTIASMLKKGGYKTGVVGKWHLGLGS